MRFNIIVTVVTSVGYEFFSILSFSLEVISWSSSAVSGQLDRSPLLHTVGRLSDLVCVCVCVCVWARARARACVYSQ